MSEPVEVAPGLRVETDPRGAEVWWLSNAARRNAVSPGALSWIASRCPALRGERVVLRGVEGPAFCSGFDLTALPVAAPEGALPDASLIAATAAMRRADATSIAVLDGHAIGAGVELACACDLRLARREIVFAVPAAELGVVYHAEGLASIHAVFGSAGARRLLLLGERVSAEEAFAAGALVRLVEDRDAMEQALGDVLDRLGGGAPLSIAGNRDLLRALDRGGPEPDDLQEHEQRRRAAYASEDHDEARRARQQGRAPRFRGR